MEKLILDFNIPDFLENDIDDLINEVNSGGLSVDCWQEQIRADLNCCDNLTDEQKNIIRKYYWEGYGIYG